MTKRNQLFRCEVCGNIVSILHEGAPALVCCNQKMGLQEENTTDAAVEKHVPLIKKMENGYKVFVGEVDHPMQEEHYIEWIQLIADRKVYSKFLNPGDKPEAFFCTRSKSVTVRAYCNLHGNWKKNS